MVTIFDMVTGEILHEDAAQETTPNTAAVTGNAMIAPRLQTVEETLTREQPAMPADLWNTDIDSLIDRC